MGTVMQTAAMKPEVALLDNEDMEDVEGDVDWQFVSLGEQQNFGIKTAGLEDKASACEMLVCYARELKDGFADYAEEVVRLMVPMLKFYFHDGVRTAAAESLPYLLDCAKIKGKLLAVLRSLKKYHRKSQQSTLLYGFEGVTYVVEQLVNLNLLSFRCINELILDSLLEVLESCLCLTLIVIVFGTYTFFINSQIIFQKIVSASFSTKTN